LYRAPGTAKDPAPPAAAREIAADARRSRPGCAPLNLKLPTGRPDTAVMFSARSHLAARLQGKLSALRLSLNTPVVAIEELPVGPATAGIALHDGPEAASLCLAVRAVRTGQLVLFTPDEDWDAAEGPSLALEAALSFAESMGFLFDEDLVAAGEAREAARRWAELLAEPVPADAEGPAENAPAGPPVLSKFRLRPERAPAEAVPSAGHGELWLRVLSRY